MSDPAPDLNATEARQGRRGLPVLIVLGVSLFLLVLIYAAIWALHAKKFSNVNGAKEAPAAAAATFNAPEPAPKQAGAQKAPGDSSVPGPADSR